MHLLLALLLIVVAALAAFALLTAVVASRITKAFPPEGGFLELGGERIHYRSLGTGPALVMVHGLAGQMKNFDYLPLEALAQRWRVILVDRPGSGRSPRADATKCGVAAQGRLIADFIRALRLPQPPLLVGHSLGGAIALSAALQDPEAIAGLALIAPLTHQVRDVAEPFRPLAVRRAWLRRSIAWTLAVPVGILTMRKAVRAVFAPEPAPDDFGVRGGGMLGLRPSAFCAASEDMIALEDDLPFQQKRYGELRLPVRVLYGEGDAVLDWRAQGEGLCAQVPQAQLTVVPGGHMLPVTQPAATAAWLEEAARASLR
ncbi:alpha/beta hydrolase [Ramlibacter sp. USB13]|uniref:Alpha/beta hydrolase n=1 Tax=Ramlibacter cellulosilyticus TaxID=2764187 RepID=A0A923MWR4_9BURK|nr:alpha/beta hydrolase [Ramlibacter cellulosilyticus]MBC5785554.1 alpha/beta hydrolase [Ramlibacter cellulosilyticus]